MIMLDSLPCDGVANETIREISKGIAELALDRDEPRGFNTKLEVLGLEVRVTIERKAPGRFAIFNIDVKTPSGTVRLGANAYAAAALIYGLAQGQVNAAKVKK